MKKTLKMLAAVCCLLAVLALPAFAQTAAITPETTMGEIRSNPSVVGSGVWTYSKFRDIEPLQTYYYNKQTLEEYVGTANAESCAAGLNLIVKNYEGGPK